MKRLGQVICLLAVSLLLGGQNTSATCGHGQATPCGLCFGDGKVIQPEKNKKRQTEKAQRIAPNNPPGLIDALETVLSTVRFFRLY